MTRVRAVLVAALVAVALAPIAGAQADKGGQQGWAGHSNGKKHFNALIFSKTAAFRHTECIPSGTVAIAQMAQRNGFTVDATENAADFNDANLAKYDVVIFLCTTGDVLNGAQQTAFEHYIQGGGGYAGIHSASDTEYDWSWYGGLVGAYFRDHPGVAGVNQQFQQATINVEDRKSAATKRLPAQWTREEEWYNFQTNPREDVHVLMSVDEWYQEYDGGRAFYTALGHKGVYWKEPLLLSHVLGGIQMAAGAAKFNCPAGA